MRLPEKVRVSWSPTTTALWISSATLLVTEVPLKACSGFWELSNSLMPFLGGREGRGVADGDGVALGDGGADP